MEHLWAPWRNRYVADPKKSASPHLFFEIGQSTEDAEHHVIYRSKSCFALLNAFPYNGGHLMVIPYREVADLTDLGPDESADLWETVNRMTQALRKCYNPHGFNIGINLGHAGGAGLPQHLHVHVVPRWSGDCNFMTVTGGTRVHPNELDTIWETLKKALEEAA